MILIACVLSFFAVFLVCLPFFNGEGGPLSEASYDQSTEVLQKKMDAIVARYLLDERAFGEGTISKRSWEARKDYLVNRYVDMARRYDYLKVSA